ncbi:MAG TPA: TetR/AcrR family transcriptional regulator [Candidatus Lambdaproteobacteria bacterium]|nr:TetR/AcrR family transcriptional regulator [SAR324 cluster bacterium]HBL54414.1 TetR/AcrR family transcriptional regulator [Deltaproteobacteria bacterium]HIA57466.1 TetR/AcrR family transcriptional regulator [Candidatus Lambdaproteobacteria bacterium]HIB45785.1 TetR/AcrR family transcriptional regulator [Candidatus Lambdaproteobacteria bacterium]HIB94502.1 TetR/AcrR family transcriptional regulator [Candidatus Lambdaproteobacteria bacterium]
MVLMESVLSPKKRRTQEERSTETKKRLLEATIDCLNELGFNKTGTVEIARRAGVSRGALVHHFPSKHDLIVATAEYHWNRIAEEVRNLAMTMHGGQLSLDAFIDGIWNKVFLIRGSSATIEMIIAARTDSKLRRELVPMLNRLYSNYDEIWSQFFHNSGVSPERIEMLFDLTIELLRGMTLQRVLKDEPEYYQKFLDSWKTIIATCLIEEKKS